MEIPKTIFLVLFCGTVVVVFGKVKPGHPFLSSGESDETPHLSRNLSDVRFLLWTRQNSENDDYYLLEAFDLENFEASPFDSSRRTYFLYHGWGGSGTDSFVRISKTNILMIEDSNIISVDYELLSDTVNYNAAVQNMYNVANLTALYIDWMAEVGGLNTENVHMAGHSLGGQCAGMTAQYTTAGNIDRVTGLDPAGPWFYNVTDDGRLDKSDANFVDVIHTNSCPFLDACVGFYLPIGHVDFFPNGGEHQPGCTLPDNITDGNWIDLFTICSHSRVKDYWFESILAGTPYGTELTFVSWPCEDYDTFIEGGCPDCGQGCLEMGFYVDRSLEGNYYLTTESREPYAKGDVQN